MNKYLQIYQELSRQIEEGKLRPGETLPSEHALSKSYGVSRETVRKALNLLSEHGYIQKIKGKGSVVLDLSRFEFPVSGLVSFKELAKKMKGTVETVVHELTKVPADRFLAQQLNTEEGDRIWKVVRTRVIDGEAIILDKDFLRANLVPELPVDRCRDSIYEYVEDDLGLAISFAKKEVVAEKPSAEDRRLLSLAGFDTVIVVKNHVYLEDACLFQYTESRHRPDKFRFVDFARRNR